MAGGGTRAHSRALEIFSLQEAEVTTCVLSLLSVCYTSIKQKARRGPGGDSALGLMPGLKSVSMSGAAWDCPLE
jgi:hypothetical protein